MKNWQQYKESEALLLQIEARFSRLKRFEARTTEENQELHGFTSDDIEIASQALKESINADISRLPGKVYYWIFPFYPGNFLQLVAALGSANAMDRQRNDPQSRQAFYQFFRTVPMEIRLGLGEKLNHPELSAQAKVIQKKIHAKKNKVKSYMDDHFGN
ncbi:MAG: hypothetical protein AAF399_19320 [Bacteroidota bacterium]